MAVGTNAEKKLFTPQHILNNSYDPSSGVLAVETVAYDTVSNTTKITTTATLGAYKINDIDPASSTVNYLCYEDSDGGWLIVKLDTTSGAVKRYATQKNNASYTTYATAYAARASLTYDYYSVAF